MSFGLYPFKFQNLLELKKLYIIDVFTLRGELWHKRVCSRIASETLPWKLNMSMLLMQKNSLAPELYNAFERDSGYSLEYYSICSLIAELYYMVTLILTLNSLSTLFSLLFPLFYIFIYLLNTLNIHFLLRVEFFCLNNEETEGILYIVIIQVL